MRKFLVPALESFGSSSFGVLSMEEEQVLLDEAGDAADAADGDLNDAERLIGVTDSMEDMAVIADGIENATEAETRLMDTVGSMAVAGSDLESEVIVPAQESYIGRRISTESIRETAKAIWKTILANLEKVWKYIEEFFYKIFGTIPSLRKRVKDLRKTVEDAAGRTVEHKKITVSVGVKALSVDYKAPKDESDLKHGLKVLSDTVKETYGPDMDGISRLGETIADVIADFNPESPEAAITKLLEAVKKGSTHVSGTANTTRFPGFKTYMGSNLMGNVTIAVRVPDQSHGALPPAGLAVIDMFRRSGCELVSTSEKEKDVPNEFEMSTLSNSAMIAVLDEVEGMLDSLESFNRGKRAADLKKTKTKLKSASDKATSAMERAEKSDDASDKHSVAYYRALLNFNTSYSRWAQQPAMPLLNASLASIRASMSVVQKSLSAYK